MEMEPNAPPTATAKRLWHIVRELLIMLREGLARRFLLADLRVYLLLRRGKLAGKALRGLLSDLSHYHSPPSSLGASASSFGGSLASSFSCRFMDPDTAIYTPHEVQFSCSSTPVYSTCRRRNQRRRRHCRREAEEITRAFEIFNSVADEVEEVPTPPLLETSPVPVSQLRVTDSPFLVEEMDEASDETIDREAEEFIRQFYAQLRRQQMRVY